MWSIKQTTDELHNIFQKINESIFQGILPLPAITIQSRGKRNALGWCTNIPVWVDSEQKDTRYEINICAENTNLIILDIAEIMLHEMVHYYASLNGIQDTSRKGTFHNKKYKELAEKYGLEVTHSKKYGYAETKLNPDTKKLFESFGFTQEAFLHSRIAVNENNITKKSGSIKHVCPVCGNKARTTKEFPLVCGGCNEPMEIEENESED